MGCASIVIATGEIDHTYYVMSPPGFSVEPLAFRISQSERKGSNRSTARADRRCNVKIGRISRKPKARSPCARRSHRAVFNTILSQWRCSFVVLAQSISTIVLGRTHDSKDIHNLNPPFSWGGEYRIRLSVSFHQLARLHQLLSCKCVTQSVPRRQVNTLRAARRAARCAACYAARRAASFLSPRLYSPRLLLLFCL
jgi:hypothetical protein